MALEGGKIVIALCGGAGLLARSINFKSQKHHARSHHTRMHRSPQSREACLALPQHAQQKDSHRAH